MAAAVHRSHATIAWVAAALALGIEVALLVGVASAPPSSALSVAWRRDLARELRAVAVDAEGNAYVTGYVRSGARRLQTLLVAKYAADGTRRWVDEWRPNVDTQTVGNDIAVASDGRVFVAGSLTGPDDAGPSGWFVRAYGPGGDVRWHQDQDEWRGQARRSAALGIDVGGGLVVAAVTAEGGSGYHEGAVRAFDTTGALAWRDPFEVSGYHTHDRALDVTVGSRGAVYVVGELDQKRITNDRPVVDQEIVLERLEASDGNLRWILVMRDSGARDADTGTAVAVRGDVLSIGARINGGPITGPRSSRGHAWAARIAPSNGSLLWQRAWGEANRRAAEPSDVAISPGGVVRVAGTIRGTGDGLDAFLRSFSPSGDPRGWLRQRSGRFLHGTGVDTTDSSRRVWLTTWRGTREDDRPDGGQLWQYRP